MGFFIDREPISGIYILTTIFFMYVAIVYWYILIINNNKHIVNNTTINYHGNIKNWLQNVRRGSSGMSEVIVY